MVLSARGAQQVTVRDLLRDIAEASDSDWAAVTRGEPFAKVLDTDTREIAVAGAVRIAASSERLVDRYREVENLKRSAIVLDMGRLSKPPRSADLGDGAARRVQPGPQGLPAGRVPRPAGRARDRALPSRGRLACGELARAFADRLERGSGGIRGGLQPRRASGAAHLCEQTRTVERASRALAPRRPVWVPQRLCSGLSTPICASSAPGGPDGLDEVMYWSKEDFGVRPVLRLSHQTIYRASTPRAILIATNQIYADHYLDAGLTLTMTIDASEAGGKPAFYMVSVSRARTRSLSGMLRSFVRSTVQGRSRDALRKILASTKASLEQH